MHTYTLIRSARTKGIRLKIAPSGQLTATASPLIPRVLVDQFVRRSEPWIAKHLHRIKNRKLRALVDWQQLSIQYLGKTHKLLVDCSGSNQERVTIQGGVLAVRPASLDPKDGPRTLEVWLKNQATTYLTMRVGEIRDVMGASYKRLRFSEQSTRWGSCSASGTLSFNWRLIHFSHEIIDYVIIHELAHTFEMNHSQNFWKIVRNYCPNYTAHKKMLSGYNSHIE